MWTHFHDMHSGGRSKFPPYDHIYIEGSESEALRIFRNEIGRDPSNITCNCCGSDYSITEGNTLADITHYYRNLPSNEMTVEEYIAKIDVLVIFKKK